MGSPCEFVAGSDARAAVVRELRDGPAETATLLDAVPVSESSTYAALSALEGREFVESHEESWRLTGRGIVVADRLNARDGIDAVLADASDYWRTHDPTALPAWARCSLWALEGCEVVRAPDTDPSRVIREVARLLEAADELDVVAPVYHEQFANAIVEREGRTRLLLTERLVDAHADAAETDVDLSHVDLRVGPASFALAVTPERTLLSLPRRDDGYDAESEVIADTQAAVDWGERVFESVWTAAEPVPTPE